MLWNSQRLFCREKEIPNVSIKAFRSTKKRYKNYAIHIAWYDHKPKITGYIFMIFCRIDRKNYSSETERWNYQFEINWN